MVENNKGFFYFLNFLHVLRKDVFNSYDIYLSTLYSQAQHALLILLTLKCQMFSDMQISYRIIKSNQTSQSKKYELSRQ